MPMFEIYNYIAYFFHNALLFWHENWRTTFRKIITFWTVQTLWVQDVQSWHWKGLSAFYVDIWGRLKGGDGGGGGEPVDKQTSCVLEIALSGDNALWQWGDSGKGQEPCCTRAKFHFPCGISRSLNRLHVESLERIRCIFSSYLLGISYLY